LKGDEHAISAAAKHGFQMFNEKGHCAACHSGWRFTDDSFHDIGLNPFKTSKPMAQSRCHGNLLDSPIDEVVAGDARAACVCFPGGADGPVPRSAANPGQSPAPRWWPVIC
jgi:cytochrome c peroxidase